MNTDNETLRTAIRDRYGKVAAAPTDRSSCGCATSCCSTTATAGPASLVLGYTAQDLSAVPDGADMGLGCGNPQAIAALKHGETVLDLGSGGGFDAFLAAAQVGTAGKVIGVDMTPEMISLARRNADKVHAHNVEFRLGEIEHLPVADGSVDVIISNCVINLATDKAAVFREAWRVLKPGGRLAIADLVALATIPDNMKADLDLITGCMAGAVTAEVLQQLLEQAGLRDIRIQRKDGSKEFIKTWHDTLDPTRFIVSATIEAVKPLQ